MDPLKSVHGSLTSPTINGGTSNTSHLFFFLFSGMGPGGFNPTFISFLAKGGTAQASAKPQGRFDILSGRKTPLAPVK